MSNGTLDDRRCLVCQQSNCDVQVSSCGCLLHSTCLSMDVLFPNPHINNIILCPSCQKSPITSLAILPLAANKFEEVFFLSRKQGDGHSNPKTASSLSSSVHSEKKRCSSAITRTCRTGRWSPEESTLVDKLIKSFDAGLLPLPHGIKLNDFLCDLLSCKTSRLTKKLKHEKLSSRSYRSAGACFNSGSGNALKGPMSTQVGASIQRAQTLFLRTLSPPSLQLELRLNITRVWRTQLANLCLQIGFLLLDTTDWVSSLNDVEHLFSEDSLEAKRKRLKHALSQDATVVKESGYDVGTFCTSTNDGDIGLNEAGLQVSTQTHKDSQSAVVRDRFDSLDGSIARESDVCSKSERKFTFSEEEMELESSMHPVSSFASLAALLTTPNESRRQSMVDSTPACENIPSAAGAQHNEAFINPKKPSAKQGIDGVIDSVVKESFSGDQGQGQFLQKVSKYLVDSDFDFQHVDLWVPTESTDIGQFLTEPKIRLTNAGCITVRSSKVSSHVLKRVSEFGVYSRNFAFSPGFGLPGRVFVSGCPSWMTKVYQAKPEQFSRVGGAKVYGISTAVGLPIPTSIGTIVVVLYSTSDLTRDTALEATCMDFFRRLQPTPRWRLCIDIASKEPEDVDIAPSLGPAHDPPNNACIVPSSPTSDLSLQASRSVNEQSLALLLGNFNSFGQGLPNNPHSASTDGLACSCMSLRLLLLRHPSCRTTVETNNVNTILSKYIRYVGAKYSEGEIARFIVNDWKSIAGAHMQPADTSTHSIITNENFDVNGPNPDSFYQGQMFHPLSDSNVANNTLRVVSVPILKAQETSPASSPANFDCV